MLLKKFPYHEKLTRYFKEQEKTWKWFSKDNVQGEQLEKYKEELLKNTYRLSEDSEAEIYKLVDIAKEKLNIDKKVILYKSLYNSDNNASVWSYGNEVHIVVSGNLFKSLTEKELLSVIAHELTHVLFYQLEHGEFEITNRIVRSIANDSNSPMMMLETARLYQLYIELFCDRGALFVVGDYKIVIEALIKVHSGLKTVSSKNYLKQANEIFSKEYEGTSQYTHPETFIRAKALEIVHNKENDKKIDEIIDGNWGLNKLDIFKQEELHKVTKTLLKIITKPKWIQTELVKTHCKNYFSNFHYSDTVIIDKKLKTFLLNVDDTIKEYFSYILLDFCFIDPNLEKAPIGQMFQIAEALEFEKHFKQIVKKELKLTVKDLKTLIEKGINEVNQLNEGPTESILEDE